MKGGHDLGGRQGLGPINPEPELQEPVFHHDWERRVFALTLATGMLGKWNIDQSRHARERQHPADYLKNSYYENWLEGITQLLDESGLVTENANAIGDLRVPTSADVEKILASGGPSTQPVDAEPLFSIGDKVRVQKNHTSGHTRVPAYAEGAVGVIADYFSSHVFPDSNAKGDCHGEPLYSVCFQASELWGSDSENSEVLIDLWQPYLESAAT